MDTISLTKDAKICNGEKTISLTSGIGKTGLTKCKRRKDFLTPYAKINSKWIKDSNAGLETIKFLEENIFKIFPYINHSRILYGTPPRVMEIQVTLNK